MSRKSDVWWSTGQMQYYNVVQMYIYFSESRIKSEMKFNGLERETEYEGKDHINCMLDKCFSVENRESAMHINVSMCVCSVHVV